MDIQNYEPIDHATQQFYIRKAEKMRAEAMRAYFVKAYAAVAGFTSVFRSTAKA
jgi:hypothetical protein